MHHDADVGDVDQPERLVKSEPGEHVSWSFVSERSVAEATAKDIEGGGYYHTHDGRSLHHFVLCRRSHGVLRRSRRRAIELLISKGTRKV